MSSPDPTSSSTIERLSARFLRLASDPRAGLVPEARPLLRELVALLDLIDALDQRTMALQSALARMQRSVTSCDD